MNAKPALLTLFSLVLLMDASCTKSNQGLPATVVRKIKYQLYTNKDFSNDNSVIKFSLFMRNHAKILFDSELAPMKIRDIPNALSKIIIEKTVPENDDSELAVGFLYTIDGVGYSRYSDTSRARETSKTVDFAFQ